MNLFLKKCLAFRLLSIIALLIITSNLIGAERKAKNPPINPPQIAEKKDDSKKQEKAKETAPKELKTYEFFEAPDYKKLTAEFFKKITAEKNLLERVYKKSPPGEQRAETLFRLADVYWLYAKYRHLRAMELYNRKYEQFAKGKIKVEPKIPRLKGGRTLRIYDKLIQSYPKYSRLDEVLFLAGFHSSEIRYPRYYKYYEKLINEFPRSRFNIDARMALGQYYFNNRRLKDAVNIYSSVLSYGPTKVYYYAMYKLSWCYYNLGKLKKAIALMKTVVKKSGEMESKHAIELRDEALRNLVLFYSDMGKIDEALAYFESVGKRELSKKVLANLAGVYFDQAKFKASITTYRRLIEFDKMAKDVPFYYSRMIISHQKRGNERRARKSMEIYVSHFEDGTKWWKRNKKEDREKALERSEKYLRYLAQINHKEAQERKDNAKYVEATKYYRLYLSKFPKHENAYEMRFLLAEIYYQLEDYASASKYYTECILDDTHTEHRYEAALSNMQALTILEEREFKEIIAKLKMERKKAKTVKDPTLKDKTKEEKGKDKAKLVKAPTKRSRSYKLIPFGTWAPKLLGACDLFILKFPNDEKVPDTLHQKAKIHYNYNSFDNAMVHLQEILKRFPKSEISKYSRRMMLDIYGIRKDWDNIIIWAKIFLKDKFFATPETKSYLYKLIQDATFKKAMDYANKEQHDKAAKLFVSLQTRYPNSKLADEALHNAILSFLLVNKMTRAKRIFERLAKKYPSSKHVSKANLAIANNYESKLNYRKAAEYYEIFVKREPKSKKAPDCLYNAALYRETMEQYWQAIKNYQKYVTLFPKRKDVPDIHFNIAAIYEKAKNYKKATEEFKKYYNTFTKDFDKNVEARFRYIKAKEKISKGSLASDYRRLIHYYNANKNKYKKTKDGAPSLAARYAAKSELILLKPLYDKFEKIKFTMPQSVLKRQIDSKAKLLKQLQDKYLNVVKVYGDSETGIESLFQVGLIYQNFGEALFHAPVPKGLNPESLDFYQQELEKQAKPIEEKSVAAYEECLKKAYELNVYTKYTAQAYKKLEQYKPEKYKQMLAKPVYDKYRASPLQNFKLVRKVEIR